MKYNGNCNQGRRCVCEVKNEYDAQVEMCQMHESLKKEFEDTIPNEDAMFGPDSPSIIAIMLVIAIMAIVIIYLT